MPADAALTWINEIFNRILNFIVWPIFFALSVIMFIWAGFMFVTAQGDPTRISAAKKALMWAIIGFIVGIAGFSITGIIQGLLGQ